MEGGMLQQSRFWAIVALFATFAAGGLLGWAVGTRAHGAGPRGWASRGGGPPGPDGVVGFLSEGVDLTAAQRDSVRAVLERHRADLDRKSGVEGKSVDLGGRRIIKKKKKVNQSEATHYR